MPGLADRSRRPLSSSNRTAAEVEALICQLRRDHPRWGARRISYEVGRRGVEPSPSRATAHRVLVRNGLVVAQAQEHKRKYRRGQRAEPMHLWQLDIVGGVPLADGRQCKMVTGIDDHSWYVAIAAVVAVPTGRAVCAAFTEAMRRYGVPSEALSDNGKQFTGKYTKPLPVEVLFERICRDNGITARLTKPRSPTTTGKKISLHQAMAGRTVTVWADQRSIHITSDGHVVRTVASRLRPEDLRHLVMRGARAAGPQPALPALRRRDGIPVLPEGGAVEIDRPVNKDGVVTIAGTTHLIGFAHAGRKVTLRLDGHLMHAVLDNAFIGSWPCPVGTDQLARLQGARTPSSPLPPPPLSAGSLRAQRRVHASGRILVGGQRIKLGPRHRGKLVTVIIEDTHLRVLHGEEEIAVRPRNSLKPITRLHVTGKGVTPN
jgi:transposase InsO family protein